MPPQDKQAKSSRGENFEEEEDKYHRPRWCPDGLSHSQKCRVQWLPTLEEAKTQYLEMLRKVHLDLAVKVHCTQKKESRPRKREWRPKPTKADETTSAGINMVFILPPEFYAPDPKELSVAQLNFGPWPVIFEKPREKNYKHLKALYLKGYINGHLVNKMLVDTGATVNIMPYWPGIRSTRRSQCGSDRGKQDYPNFFLHHQQQEYIHCPAREGLDSCQLLHPFYDAPMSDSVGW
jgi:hypothetical protein